MNNDFDSRFNSAIERGKTRQHQNQRDTRKGELSQEEIKELHMEMRLGLVDAIEQKIDRIIDAFPGFEPEALFGEMGWGWACFRDDLELRAGSRKNLFSRFELSIRPLSELGVLDLKGKATIKNREFFNHSLFRKIQEVDPAEFEQAIETWTIDYAEQFAAHGR